MKWLKRLLLLIFIGFTCGVGFVVALYFYFAPQLPDVTSLKEVQLQTPMRVYSADGELISQFGEKRRIPLSIDEIPEAMVQAVLATEDTRFYQHPGIDPIGITRAALNLIITGEKSQGASTITQQVARNFFLSREKTYIRKIKEIFLALKIEQELSKDEILELYLNKIPLGYRSYGVGAAAQVYYGKQVHELTLAQIAVIAGLPKAPSALNPIRSPERAKERRSVVLGRMLTVGFISPEQYLEANQAPISAKYHGAEITLSAPYLAEMVRQQVLEQFGEEAYTSGMDVYTTIKAELQNSATQALRSNLLAYDKRHGFRGEIATLWTADSEALTQEQALSELKKLPNYGSLIAGVVLSVEEQQATVLTKKGNIGVIPWDAMKWARRFITDERQGAAPKSPAEILQAGYVIWLEHLEGDSYQLSQLPDAGAAVVAISPNNGAIEALVGGFSFNQSKFNRVNQAKRQVGSNIKPFLYSAALDNGYTLASLINDAPINRWDQAMGVAWRPKNSPPVYAGPLRLRVALAQSKNVVSVRLIRDLGVNRAIEHLSKFGFPANELPRNESLALGSASLTPLQVASAYGSFANGGFLVEPFFIDRVETGTGEIIFQHQARLACEGCASITKPDPLDQAATEFETPMITDVDDSLLPSLDEADTTQPLYAPRIISESNAFLITQALNSAIWGGGDWSANTGWNGTGWRAARELKRHDIAGKTGTTNDAKDAWFSGFSPDLVVTSWIGFDSFERSLGVAHYNPNLGKNQTTGGEFGARTAQPAWIEVMKTALADKPVHVWAAPQSVTTVRIDRSSGLLSNRHDHSARFEYFERGTEPKKYQEAQTESVFDGEDELF